jgi:hypothetical protein
MGRYDDNLDGANVRRMIRSEHTLILVLCLVLVGLAIYQHVLLR